MILCCASAPCYTVLMNTDVILFDPAGRLQWAESIYTLSTPRAMTETPVAAVRLRLDALARVHLDDRLSLLQTGEWGFDTDHIRQVNRVLDDFLNLPSRRKIRQLAGEALDHGRPSQWIVDQWFTDEQRSRLVQLVEQIEVPDPLMVACCAWLEIHDAARAAYLRQEHRRGPRPDFDAFVQTPEERSEDLRLVNAV